MDQNQPNTPQPTNNEPTGPLEGSQPSLSAQPSPTQPIAPPDPKPLTANPSLVPEQAINQPTPSTLANNSSGLQQALTQVQSTQSGLISQTEPTNIDSQAPVKAKQILQPQNIQEQSSSAQEPGNINDNSAQLEDNSQESQNETDIDPNIELATWSADEFVSHQKPSYWHFAVVGGAFLLAIIIFLFTKEILSAFVVIVLGVVFAIYGSAKPKTVQYRLTGEGVYTDDKLHKYNDFKSFSLIETTGLPYVQLMSRKRFMVPLTLHIEPNLADKITEIIGKFVPYDQKKQDAVDKLSAKLRF